MNTRLEKNTNPYLPSIVFPVYALLFLSKLGTDLLPPPPLPDGPSQLPCSIFPACSRARRRCPRAEAAADCRWATPGTCRCICERVKQPCTPENRFICLPLPFFNILAIICIAEFNRRQSFFSCSQFDGVPRRRRSRRA